MAAAAWLRSSLFAVLRLRPPPRPLFPYTTLFRSRRRLGQLRAVETALAVHVRRRPQRAPQWSGRAGGDGNVGAAAGRKRTRLNSSHTVISYAAFCLKKKKSTIARRPTIAQPHRVL